MYISMIQIPPIYGLIISNTSNDKKVAYLKGNVKLNDGKGTLTTPDLEYDVDTKIGIYKNGGKVVNNKKTVLNKQRRILLYRPERCLLQKKCGIE